MQQRFCTTIYADRKPPFYPMFKKGWTLPWTIHGERLITKEISQIVVCTGTAFKSHITLNSK